MDTVLFFCILGGLNHYTILVFYFRVEEKFAGGKFREIPFGVDIIFAGGKFRAKSKFANIAKISSARKIGVIQYIRPRISLELHIIGPTPTSFEASAQLKAILAKPITFKGLWLQKYPQI